MKYHIVTYRRTFISSLQSVNFYTSNDIANWFESMSRVILKHQNTQKKELGKIYEQAREKWLQEYPDGKVNPRRLIDYNNKYYVGRDIFQAMRFDTLSGYFAYTLTPYDWYVTDENGYNLDHASIASTDDFKNLWKLDDITEHQYNLFRGLFPNGLSSQLPFKDIQRI